MQWLKPGVISLALSILALRAETNTEARFIINPRQLILEGRRSGEGYFSQDGKALVFQSEREPGNPFYQIYLLDLESGDSHRISTGVGKTTCAFFRPHKDEVLFASTHLDPEARAKQRAELDFRATGKEKRYSWDYDEQMDIFSTPRNGGTIRRLTDSPGYDAEGSYSPDGQKIVFCSLRNAYPTNRLSPAEIKRLETDPSWFGEIYLMDADGSNQRRLTTSPGYDGGPFFSPDGKRIIWRRFDDQGLTADIFTMKTDGSDPKRLTDFGAMSWAPFSHPSGKYIVFTANKFGFDNFELFLIDGAGARQPVRVTFTPGFDGLPVFSPDGQKLCWASGRTSEGKPQLFLAGWNHQAALDALHSAPLRTGAVPPQEQPQTREERAPPRPKNSRPGKLSPEITQADLQFDVAYLASDELGGRMTGTAGTKLAGEFIAEQLRRAGLKPVGTNKTILPSFEFTAGVEVVTNENHLWIGPEPAVELGVEKDFRPLSFSASGQADGPVVFAGYGLSMPGKPGVGYDSYSGLDVSNQIVLVLRYVPEAVEPQRRQELNRYAGLRYKAMLARERGAKAILIVTGPNSPNAGELVPLTFDSTSAGSGIIAATINAKAAAAILAGSGRDLQTLQSALDSENPHAETGFQLTNRVVRVTAGLKHVVKSDRNLVAWLPPGKPAAGVENLLLGAHYDHLGLGEAGAMGRKGEENQIHNGADDNASGVAALLELAAALAAERKQHPEQFSRGIVFGFWAGEEIGLIGSSWFAEHPPLPLSNIVAYVNFDMVGRLRENKLILQGTGSSGVWRRLAEKRNVAAGFNLVLQEDPYLPTDVTAFYPKRIPVLNFFTGSHEDYHRPTDDIDTLNYEGLERITRFGRGMVLDLLKEPARPDYLQVAQSSTGGSRDSLRAYLGTIPDYGTEVAGVKLSGVRAGSPADKGGLKGGDVIVEFAGQKITNIYDYTYALDAARIGKPVEIVVLRDGAKRVVVQVTPEARK